MSEESRDESTGVSSTRPNAIARLRKRWDSHTTVAAVTALAAIAGAAVGGFVTYQGDRSLQAERSQVAARGAARVLQSEFLSAAVRLEVELEQKRLIVPDGSTAVKVSTEDQELIAANLGSSAWATVAAAEGGLEQEILADSGRDMAVLRARAGLSVPLVGPHLHIEKNTLNALLQAARALQPLVR